MDLVMDFEEFDWTRAPPNQPYRYCMSDDLLFASSVFIWLWVFDIGKEVVLFSEQVV
uniref:Uncharacterized protein n=1 Tax=Rhizophagus irregularis (strain DAOM 181602 / DAOM 197198 / MUCL 43194) TaxID=747089 RepID=U9U4C6_RHIID